MTAPQLGPILFLSLPILADSRSSRKVEDLFYKINHSVH